MSEFKRIIKAITPPVAYNFAHRAKKKMSAVIGNITVNKTVEDISNKNTFGDYYSKMPADRSVILNLKKYYCENDPLFTTENSISRGVISNIIKQVGIYIDENINDLDLKRQFYFTQDVINNKQKYEYIYSILTDRESKEIFLSVLMHRMTSYIKNINPYKVKITPEHYISDSIKLPTLINENNVSEIPYTVYFRSHYTIPGVFELSSGENVIDGGAWIGDSSTYFSQLVGSEGKVYAFECNPTLADLLKRNLERNKVLNVEIVNKGLSDAVQSSYVIDIGGSSWVQSEPPPEKIDCNFYRIDLTDIDSFIQRSNISKIGLIKLDVEGFERQAILGASELIKRDKPKLAVSLYHLYDDFHVIPEIIMNIRNDYKFYIRHATDGYQETVLFAI